ncbi:hypothetical protein Tco_1352462 [Tanacetum coccineum]
MDAPPSPNHVFNFPEEEFEEDPEEEPEVEAEEDVPLAATPPVGSPITPPPLSESSSDTEAPAPIVADGALEVPPAGSTYEVGVSNSLGHLIVLSALRRSDNENMPESILTGFEGYSTKPGEWTKTYSSPAFIANCFYDGYLMMVVEVPDSS